MKAINKLFKLEYGNRAYTNKAGLDSGTTPIISSQSRDNGVYGFFDAPLDYQPPIITVPRTGSIGVACVHLIPCNTTDDVIVLTPLDNYSKEYLFYVASMIRKIKWRYNYGRKITPYRIGKLEVINPNSFSSQKNYNSMNNKLTPNKRKVFSIDYKAKEKDFLLSDLFIIQSGDFHSVNELNKGDIPLISCSDEDNGISGFYDIPNSKIYKDILTVAYDGKPLSTKYHDYSFTAYDNVGMLFPKNTLKKTTLFFILIILNKLRWRYGYGRKCYRNKLENLKISLPVDSKGNVDEDYIEDIIQKRDLFGVMT